MGGQRTIGRLLQLWRAARVSFAADKRGFTIVEVMIVLAVTGALFIAAAILISGKQNQAEFNQAIQQIQSQVQQSMSEVTTGYFPSNANFQCAAAGGGPVVLSAVSPNGQGANAGCIFAGKVMQFRVSGTAPEQYAVFTVAAAQKNASGQEATALTAPKVVAPGVASPAGFPDITTTTILQNGLVTTANPPAGMWYNNGGADITVGAVAFVPSFAQYASGSITSGSQQLSVIPVTGTSLGMSKKAAADAINTNLAGSVVNPTNGVFICYVGGTDQSGLVTIGGSSHPLSVTLKVMQGTKTCGR
jgi:prepilin-type N-terminal cleavage/methylation domain-containing protein